MKQGLSLRTSQHLVLTPQLQQSIRLLQLSTLELGQEVEQMLDENPFLERTLDDDTPYDVPALPQTASATAIAEEANSNSSTEYDEPNWDGDGIYDFASNEGEWGDSHHADEADATELARNQESLYQFLYRQSLELHLDETDACALRFLIESLNEDGYLEDPLEDLAHTLAAGDAEAFAGLVPRFTVALQRLQQMEPTGVGARNLAECLRLQLQARLDDAEEGFSEITPKCAATLHTALRICDQPMDVLARRDIRTLMHTCHASDVEIREAITLIARLEPKPGRRFVDVERHVIVPDVLVIAVPKTRANASNGPQFRVMLNPDVMPRLRVHDIYANVLRNHRSTGNDASTHSALQQRLQEARWFIKNIQQRFDTILRVSMAIVERQKNFFTHGELAMRPLVLREIADELGLHESTISRVTTAKYMATPFGTFELKYFFGSGLGTDSGGNASSTAVRALIKQFISAENTRKPLSDSQISDMLKEQGIDCARRTVAKYREGLKIAPASLRKAL